MAVAILDTNVYIDHWERGLYPDTLENLRQAYIIRHSAVVLSELRRGARRRAADAGGVIHFATAQRRSAGGRRNANDLSFDSLFF